MKETWMMSKLNQQKVDMNLNFILETINYFCNISSCLLNKISMDTALGKTPRFLS